MTGKQRFINTVERKPVDRPAIWMSAPTGIELERVCTHYGVGNWHDLQVKAGDDVYAFDIPYNSGYATHIAAAFDWYMNGSNVDPDHRTLTADGCFKDAEDLSDLDFFQWPDPRQYIDAQEVHRRCAAAPAGRATLAQCWSAHFQDSCAAFGMETALMNMVSNPEIYMAVDEKIVDFYLKANEVIFQATKGMLDAVIFANDFGSQQGLMLSADMIAKYVMPGSKRLVEQAHSYGVKVIYHSCGAIFDAIPHLLNIGVDLVHPIQATAHGMNPKRLKESFGNHVCFCGGVDIQELLPNGTPAEVKSKVWELRDLFPTGLVISPSQGVILEDVPPVNIEAMLEADLAPSSQKPMTSRQRVLATFDRQPTDRVPRWCGASPEFLEKSKAFLGVDNDETVFIRFGDDFRRVHSRFIGPADKTGSNSVFGVTHHGIGCGQANVHPLQDATLEDVEAYHWPDPDWVDVSHIRTDALAYGGEYAILGGEWCPFFHDAIDLMGMESLMIAMYEEPEVVSAMISHIVDYYYKVCHRIFETAGDVLDIFFLGNDFGSQTGPLLGRALFDQFFTPHLKQLSDLGHSYGLKVMLHCCGSFVPLMPSLIEAGIDGLQGLQPTTKDMDVVNLVEKFEDNLIFNGCVDSIHYLIDGTPETVATETKRVLNATKAGGFILSASHDYLLEETPVENVLAMYDCI